MSVQDQLLALQWAQLKHDESYHKDVLILPPAQRMKHMALHNAKYTAYFLDALDRADAGLLNRTLTDAFIIVLATANILNQDLSRSINCCGEEKSSRSPSHDLATRLPRDTGDPLWLVRQYALHNGQLAKLCESWDHLEAVPFREGMMICNSALLSTVLAEASARGIDLIDAYHSRIHVVETRSIFDRYYRRGAGSET